MEKENPNYQSFSDTLAYQSLLYFGFAGLMILVNIGLQNFHLSIIYPWLASRLPDWRIFEVLYLSQSPYNMPEIIGSIVAVGITYLLKFILDKFFVFKKTHTDKTQTQKEFIIYFLFAILTTLENLAIQFVLGLITPLNLNIRIIIALIFGYGTKFVLDRKYSFRDHQKAKLDKKKK